MQQTSEQIEISLPLSGFKGDFQQIQPGFNHEIYKDNYWFGYWNEYFICFVLNIFLWLLIIIVSLFTNGTYWSFWLLLAFYILYMAEVIVSPTSEYLWNMREVSDFKNFISAIKRKEPTIWIRNKCHPNPTNTHPRLVYENYKDSDGKPHSMIHSKSYLEPSLIPKESLQFKAWSDISGMVNTHIINYFGCVRVLLVAEWTYGNEATRNACQLQKRSFIEKNLAKYSKCLFTEGMEIGGFSKKRMMVVSNHHKISPYFKWWVFIILSLVSCSYFYRFWLKNNSPRAKFSILKSVLV